MSLTLLKPAIVSVFLAVIFLGGDSFAMDIATREVVLRKKVKSIRELRDQNVVKQSTDYSCGAAGLATILNYHFNDPISENEIILGILRTTNLAKVKQRKGFSLLDLKKFVESRGYKVTGYKMDIDFLRKLDIPVLVPIKFKEYRHFIIVKAVVGDRVFVADPSMGNMSMKINCFNGIWQDGVGMVIERKGEKDPFLSRMSSLRLKKEDLKVVDMESVERNLESEVIRTAIHVGEF
ncbi:MAG: C39 family peptidase [Candidatus Omnitrophica bacterium]|nr:C39 family peptidase [Candidatus Omnitrophota bacterium]